MSHLGDDQKAFDMAQRCLWSVARSLADDISRYPWVSKHTDEIKGLASRAERNLGVDGRLARDANEDIAIEPGLVIMEKSGNENSTSHSTVLEDAAKRIADLSSSSSVGSEMTV
jgi:hypothetical protein